MLSPHRDERPESTDAVLKALGLPLEIDVAVAAAPMSARGWTPLALVLLAVLIGVLALGLVAFVMVNIGS